jgi:hypothetical protein
MRWSRRLKCHSAMLSQLHGGMTRSPLPISSLMAPCQPLEATSGFSRCMNLPKLGGK